MIGQLTLVVGASGVGKDTLLGAARAKLFGDDRFLFQPLDITRLSNSIDDHFNPIDEREFRLRQKAGDYALDWRANGTSYGLPRAIEPAINCGKIVVANASRTVASLAHDRFPLSLVLITAPDDLVRRRLLSRGREPVEDIEMRLRRAHDIEFESRADVTIANDQSIEVAAARLVDHLIKLAEARRA